MAIEGGGVPDGGQVGKTPGGNNTGGGAKKPEPEGKKPESGGKQPESNQDSQVEGDSSSTVGVTTVTAGKNFKSHFLSKKKLLGDFLGTSYPKLKTDGPKFLQDIEKIIKDETVALIGQGTLKKGQPLVNVYRGNGLTVITKPNGEFVTLLKSGEGMDLGIEIVKPKKPN